MLKFTTATSCVRVEKEELRELCVPINKKETGNEGEEEKGTEKKRARITPEGGPSRPSP